MLCRLYLHTGCPDRSGPRVKSFASLSEAGSRYNPGLQSAAPRQAAQRLPVATPTWSQQHQLPQLLHVLLLFVAIVEVYTHEQSSVDISEVTSEEISQR